MMIHPNRQTRAVEFRRTLQFVLISLCLNGITGAVKESGGNSGPTFNRDIAPIIFNNCSICHRPDESAPFSLLGYDDVRKRGKQIADVIDSGYMPPWQPEIGKPDFIGERSLTDEEKDLFYRWIDSGMPEGHAHDLPAPPRWAKGWQSGEPDMVIELPEPYTLPPDGVDIYRNFVMPVPINRTRYIRAVEIRPSNKRVVHHGRLMVDSTNESSYQDSLDEEPGYDGMEGLESSASPSGHFIGWTPGRTPGMGEQETAWQLDPGMDLVLQLHMVPTGKPEPVQVRIGLYFTEKRPPIMPLILNLFNKSIDIPPGEANYPLKAQYRLPVDIEVYTVYPHAHYLGRILRGYAVLPDGEEQTLIDIRDWDFNWQDEYRYTDPVTLPRGSVIHMDYTYDNSSKNIRNPNNPPQHVISGPRSDDEMGDLILQVMTRSNHDRNILAHGITAKSMNWTLDGVDYILATRPNDPEFLMVKGELLRRMGRFDDAVDPLRRSLGLDPENQTIHSVLGRVYRALGRHQEALDHFLEVMRIEPSDPLEHADLGRAYLDVGGSVDRAIHHLRQAIELRPEYFRAHMFLGVALAQERDFDGSIRSFRRALEIDPDHRETHMELCSTMITAGYLDRAIPELMLVRKNHPLDPEVLTMLGSALAMRGELAAAVKYFQNSVRIKPSTGAYMGIGMARSEQGRDQESADAFGQALELNTDPRDELRRLVGLMRTAGELDKAVGCLQKITERDPRNLNARMVLGDLYIEKKNGRGAFEQFKAASEIAPDSVEVLHRFAGMIRMSNQPAQAIPVYERILELSWSHALAHYELGTIHIREGNHHKGITHLETALELNPGFEAAMRDLDQARKIVNQAGASN